MKESERLFHPGTDNVDTSQNEVLVEPQRDWQEQLQNEDLPAQ